MTAFLQQTAMTVTGRIEFDAADRTQLRAGLIAALHALDHGLEPNMLWAEGYRIAIMLSGPRLPDALIHDQVVAA